MKRGLGFVAAWVGATMLAVVIAAAAVGNVRSGVTNEPTALGSPSAAAITSDLPSGPVGAPGDGTESTPIDTEGEPTSTVPSTTTSTIEDESEISGSTSTTTTITTDASSSTTTTTPGATSSTTTTTVLESTTTTVAAQYSRTVDTAGGSVTIIVDGDSVGFGGAVPRTGWKVELEKPGPDEVKVKFEKNDDSDEVEVKASVEDGQLAVSVSGSDDD